MNKRPIDKTKKSNIKCEHCKFWCEWSYYGENKDYYCKNPCSPQHNNQRNYWNRCKQFEWKDKTETEGKNA